MSEVTKQKTPRKLMIEEFPEHMVFPHSAYVTGMSDVDKRNAEIEIKARAIEAQAIREGRPFPPAELSVVRDKNAGGSSEILHQQIQ